MASQPTEISNPSGNTPNSNNQNPNNQITNQNVRPAPSLSEGAIAGVAIGCAFVGAVIGAAILFLLFRRRQARQPVIYHQQHLPYNHAHRSAEKGPSVVTGAVANNVDNLIPQPVEDDAITKELSRIRDNIKNHVRTYYRFDASGAEGIQESQLVELATATGLRTSALLSSLADGSKRGDAISLFIAWVLMSRCEGNHHPSFLPADIAALAVAVPGKDVRNSAHAILYSKWKAITGALLQDRYGKQAQDTGAHSQAIGEAVAELNAVLAPFVQGSADGGQRRRNLEMIMSRAANFTFVLFSQPGSFQFDFAAERGETVVFPGLQQVIGDQGQPLHPPRPLWEKEFATEGGM